MSLISSRSGRLYTAIARNRSMFPRASTCTPDIKNVIDCAVDYVFYIRGACGCTWKHRSIPSNSCVQPSWSARNQGHDKRSLIACEVFIKVMNGLVMTLVGDKRFLCVWLLYNVSNFCRFANGSEVPRYRPSPTSWRSFFFSVHSAAVKCYVKVVKQKCFHSE